MTMMDTQDATMTRMEPPTAVAGTHLVSETGTTTIASAVVAKIAGIAAREVEGVHKIVPGNITGTVSGFAQRMVGGDMRGRGVGVEVGQREAAVDLNVVVDYGVTIGRVADQVRQNVIDQVEMMTGLVVKEVNINVLDLYFAEDDAAAEEAARRGRRVQ